MQENDKILNDLTFELRIPGAEAPINILGIKCAQHTLQLDIQYSLKAIDETNKNVISLCRNVAKILRTKTAKYAMIALNFPTKMPRLDVETRWGSSFNMVNTCYF